MITAAERWGVKGPPNYDWSCFDLLHAEEFEETFSPAESNKAAEQLSRNVLEQFTTLRFTWQNPLDEVNGIINSSRTILELKEDWDGEGALPISQETWQQAVTFLRRNIVALWEGHGIRVESPSIVPLNNGSLDIHWKVARRELLVNVPPDAGKDATYYGDNRQGGNVVEGDLDVNAKNLWLLVWLSE